LIFLKNIVRGERVGIVAGKMPATIYLVQI